MKDQIQFTISDILSSPGDFAEQSQSILDAIKVEDIALLINDELIAYCKSPYHNYSRLTKIFPLFDSDGFKVNIQVRDKNLKEQKTFIQSLALDVRFKVLRGTFEIIYYELQGQQLREFKRTCISENQNILLEQQKHIVEFHPINNEDAIILICQSQIKTNTTQCFDVKSKKPSRAFSTNTKESRLRIYSQYLIESNSFKSSTLLEEIFKLAQTEELRWSIIKTLKSHHIPSLLRILKLMPKSDKYYQQSLRLKKVIKNVL